MAKMKLSPPWAIRYWQIEELFKYDPEVHVIYDEDNYEIKLYVDNDEKASALNVLLPQEYVFGNVTLKVAIESPDGEILEKSDDLIDDELFETAFDGNGAFSFAKTVHGVMMLDGITYVVFNKRVVQYYIDSLSDYFGNCSTLYQEIAKDVIGEKKNIFYSTDIQDPVFSTFSEIEWP